MSQLYVNEMCLFDSKTFQCFLRSFANKYAIKGLFLEDYFGNMSQPLFFPYCSRAIHFKDMPFREKHALSAIGHLIKFHWNAL